MSDHCDGLWEMLKPLCGDNVGHCFRIACVNLNPETRALVIERVTLLTAIALGIVVFFTCFCIWRYHRN